MGRSARFSKEDVERELLVAVGRLEQRLQGLAIDVDAYDILHRCVFSLPLSVICGTGSRQACIPGGAAWDGLLHGCPRLEAPPARPQRLAHRLQEGALQLLDSLAPLLGACCHAHGLRMHSRFLALCHSMLLVSLAARQPSNKQGCAQFLYLAVGDQQLQYWYNY